MGYDETARVDVEVNGVDVARRILVVGFPKSWRQAMIM